MFLSLPLSYSILFASFFPCMSPSHNSHELCISLKLKLLLYVKLLDELASVKTYSNNNAVQEVSRPSLSLLMPITIAKKNTQKTSKCRKATTSFSLLLFVYLSLLLLSALLLRLYLGGGPSFPPVYDNNNKSTLTHSHTLTAVSVRDSSAPIPTHFTFSSA